MDDRQAIENAHLLAFLVQRTEEVEELTKALRLSATMINAEREARNEAERELREARQVLGFVLLASGGRISIPRELIEAGGEVEIVRKNDQRESAVIFHARRLT